MTATPKPAVADPPSGPDTVSHLSVPPRPAEVAGPRLRHWGLLASFLLVVVLPTLAGAAYLWGVAKDQYQSTVAFSVHSRETASPIELLGGMTDLATGGSSDSDTLHAFIQSQEMVEKIDARLDLASLFGGDRTDPVFMLARDAVVEDLVTYWNRMVRIDYDRATRLLEVRVRAFAPGDARTLAHAILLESQALIDELSSIARTDSIAFAEDELARTVERLKDARQNITEFRSRTQIVDPTADISGQMTILGQLEGQLVQAVIDADLLRDSTREGDVRIARADRRIEIIEARIGEERKKLGGGDGTDDYAALLGEYERLAVERLFAEESYTAALAGYDLALADARRTNRFLAAHIKPTLPESPEYPLRATITGGLGFFLLMAWSIAVLVYYSVRDRR